MWTARGTGGPQLYDTMHHYSCTMAIPCYTNHHLKTHTPTMAQLSTIYPFFGS